MTGSLITDRWSRGIINALAMGSFIGSMGQYIVWVIMSIYLNQVRGVGYIAVGIVFLIGGLAGVPVSIFGGNLLDRIGRRSIQISIPWMLVFIYGALFYLIYFQLSTLWIIVLFIVVSPLQSVQFVSFNSIVSDVTAPQDRVAAFGLLRIAANAGIGVGLVTGGLISEFSYAGVFLLPALGSVLEGLLYFFLVPETSKQAIQSETRPKRGKLLSMPLGDRLFITISLALAASWFFTGMFESALTPLYLTSIRNYPNLYVTILFAVNTAVVLIAQGPINRAFLNFRDTSRIVLGIVLFALGFLVFATTYYYPLLIAAVIVLTIGENIMAPSSSALITKIAPEDRRGMYLGFYSSVGNLFSPFRPMFGTALLAFTVETPYLTWYVISAITMGLGFGFIVLFRGTNASIEDRLLQ